jgi:hypothetical protein
LKRDHGSAVSPAGSGLTELGGTTPNEICLHSANQCAVGLPHSRGTFHFAFLSLEFEIKFMVEALPACQGPNKAKAGTAAVEIIPRHLKK